MTFFLESIRDAVDYRLVIFVHAFLLTVLFVSSFLVCRLKLLPLCAGNPFIQLFKLFELGLVGYGLLRLTATFFSTPIIPRDTPTDVAIVVFTIYVLMGSFRYVSYVGFRITWVDPKNPTENRLNKALVNAIEEKNHLLRGLIASNRVIGISALASSLAHQLSQPLTTIALRAETTRRDLIHSDQNFKSIASLDEISAQSARLAELVQNLRQLFGSKYNHFQAVKLQKVTNEILEVIKPALESQKIALRTQYRADPTVYGDSIQLQQVLINVLNNAMDSLSQSQGSLREILITLDIQNDDAIICVRDTGQGIKPEILLSMFELYNTSKLDGLGVGLWLCNIIMERHQGKISGFNPSDGGALFEIQIPLHQKNMEVT